VLPVDVDVDVDVDSNVDLKLMEYGCSCGGCDRKVEAIDKIALFGTAYSLRLLLVPMRLFFRAVGVMVMSTVRRC
jgi:hypothetical protein